jgi:hypothetical protein
LHVIDVPPHTPAVHVSVCVHALPSSHVVPSETFDQLLGSIADAHD